MNIEILEIFISSGHDFKGRHGKERLSHGTIQVAEAVCVEGKGIEGDRFFGYRDDFKGQITFFSIDVANEVGSYLGIEDLDLSRFRRNAIVSGVDLNDLVGKRFSIGDAEFLGTEECSPCYWMDQAIGEGAEDLLKGKGGLRCRIVKSGTIEKGITELTVC